MSEWRSTFISVPAADRDAVNAALAEAGHGPNSLSIPMRGQAILDADTPIEEATRYGCHWYVERQEFRAVRDIVRGLSERARIVSQVSEEEATELEIDRSDKEGYNLVDDQAGERIYVQIDPLLIDDFNRGLNWLGLDARGKYTIRIDHPTDPENRPPVLRFRTGDEVEIMEAGRDGRIKQVLASLFDAAKLTQPQRKAILDVVNVKGQTVNILALLPPATVWPRLTAREARELGYLNSSAALRG